MVKFFITLRKRSKLIVNYFVIMVVVFLVGCIVVFPNESVKAAYDGLNIWFTVVLPALLPFFIGAELLVGLGVVKFIGTLLEPVMRPLFNVPGEGSFVFAISVTSGYPVGVKISSKLRSDRLVSRVEAQRLVAFCSTSGPLFLIGAVSIGMFQSSEIGILLAIAHYTAAIIVGLLFSFYKSSSIKNRFVRNGSNDQLIKKAFRQLNANRRKSPSFGVLLGNAVRESINTMLMVGGFIILFSVVINILNIIGFIDFVSQGLYLLFKPLSLDLSIIRALLTGIFEITIGCKLAAEALGVDFVDKIAIAAFIVGWSGFSIHAQAISILGSTDINPYIYIFSKLLHGIFSYALVYFIYPIATIFFRFTTPTFSPYTDLSISAKLLSNLKLSIEIFIGILIVLLIFSMTVGIFMWLNSLRRSKKY
ncbi:MAG: sporulation integral membrane protein YlbJ [Clostridiaceae bacterium]|nr:sporulation integral membrane protein YlbJ [Clostridiaceae bacterium]